MESTIHSPAFHRTRCATAVAAVVAALGSQAAYAQQAPAPANEAAPAVVQVSGTRLSVISAIERKKGAGTVTDSIVAEDIGQFPDKNVGEALSRITGVQLSRDFGEGGQIAIRGVEPNLNRVEINGMSVLSTNNTAGRGAELRELPAELIKSIDVYKGVTADITEGGVGGTVSIKTNKPLDFKKFTFATTLSGEHATLRGGVQPRGSLLIADRFLNGNLGLMANVVYDNVLTQGDFVRNTGWRFLREFSDCGVVHEFSLRAADQQFRLDRPVLNQPCKAGRSFVHCVGFGVTSDAAQVGPEFGCVKVDRCFTPRL